MRITRLQANHYEKPMGFDLTDLSLSWVAESEKAKHQKSARVRIATTPDMAEASIVHDSGVQEGDAINSLSYQPGIELQPRTRYYWNVEVAGDDGDQAVSETSWFETGKMEEKWQAQWITAQLPDDVHPYFRKGFELQIPMEEIASARVYASAAGIYELYLNGEKLSDEYLLPGSHAYEYWMQYQTFDVTEQIKSGANVLGAMVGKGWFSGRFALGNTDKLYGNRMALICELIVTAKDGSTQVIATDDTWQSHVNPVTKSSIYDGEYYDARLEEGDWCVAGAALSADWVGVEGIDLNVGPLVERLSPLIQKQEHFAVQEVIVTPKKELIFDFSQNMTGWVEFEADLPEGTRVFLQYTEILQDGCFYNENLRSAKAEFEYIARGGKELVRPHFTFYGFRYIKVEITDATGKELSLEEAGMKPEDFTAWVIHSTMQPTIQIETNDERVNRLVLNAIWGQKGNFLDVPTDCPQRDERMGWTGDAQIFCGTASFFADTAAFYQKYMRDTREEQIRLDGSVPYVVPNPKVGGTGIGHGSCAWADVATVIPWTQYLYFGDKSMLAKQYDTMKDWVEYVKRTAEEAGTGRLWQTGFHFADWLALDNYKDPESSMGGTDMYYIASAYFYYSTKLTADAAEMLGKTEDVVKYRRLQQEIKEAFQKEYFTPNGRIAEQTQTAHVVALFFDLLPEEHRARVAETLKTMIKENGMHLNTGFVGTPYLCRVLSEADANDYAYRLLMKDDYPSWLYEVKMGATTIWERWNSVMPDGHLSGTGMNSLNHYSYGSVVEWIMRDVCGLNPVLETPGFRKVVIKPQPDALLTKAEMIYDSPCGRYVSGWKLNAEEKTIMVSVTVPFDCEAELYLPDGQKHILEAGSYTFTCQAPEEWFHGLSLQSTLREIMASDSGKAVLKHMSADLVQNLEVGVIPMDQVGDMTLAAFAEMMVQKGFGAVSQEMMQELDKELKQCR